MPWLPRDPAPKDPAPKDRARLVRQPKSPGFFKRALGDSELRILAVIVLIWLKNKVRIIVAVGIERNGLSRRLLRHMCGWSLTTKPHPYVGDVLT